MLSQRLDFIATNYTKDLTIILWPETFKLVEEKVIEVEEIRQTGYWMGEELIANGMIATGIFAQAEVIEHISRCSAVKQKQDNNKYAIDVSSFVLPICRNYQSICTGYLKVEPSLEMVINALLLTGRFEKKVILEHLIDSFTNPLTALE